MAKGRPRASVKLKVHRGTHRRDRDGREEDEVEAPGAPREPATLAGEALTFWRRVVPLLVAMGVVGEADAPALEMMCWWWGRYVKATGEADALEPGDGRALQVLGLASMASKQFDRVACRFGMTPSDRTRLRAGVTRDVPTPVPPRKRS